MLRKIEGEKLVVVPEWYDFYDFCEKMATKYGKNFHINDLTIEENETYWEIRGLWKESLYRLDKSMARKNAKAKKMRAKMFVIQGGKETSSLDILRRNMKAWTYKQERLENTRKKENSRVK